VNQSSHSPNPALRLILTGAGSAITIAAAASVWLQLSLKSLSGALQPPVSTARLRRGRVG
jgi:hypothetical protein